MIKILNSQSIYKTTKKAIFLICQLLVICTWSQSTQINCVENFELDANRISTEHSQVDSIILSWDFTKTSNKQDLLLSYEIQPLNACWLGLEGKIRSEIIFLKTDYNANNTKSQLEIEFRDLDTKCFKWKAVIINSKTGCKTETKWQFASFL